MNRGTIFWGMALIILGVVFLLDQLGLLQGVDIWSIFWPLLLIGWGFSQLFGNIFQGAQAAERLEVPRAGVGKADIELHHGAGQLYLGEGAAAETLLQGKFANGVACEAWREGSRMSLELRQPPRLFGLWSGQPEWRVELNPTVILSLSLETGASASQLDLSELQVTELNLRTGASSSRVVLPAAAGFTEVDIRSGVASVVLEVPEGVAASIRTRGGMASIEVNQKRFPRQAAGRYQSPAYEEAENRVEINVETGVGMVRIS